MTPRRRHVVESGARAEAAQEKLMFSICHGFTKYGTNTQYSN